MFSDTGGLVRYPVTNGQKGLLLTFEGLCGVVLGDPVCIGLLAGHGHLATLKLHRNAVMDGYTWEPTTADDEHYHYALKGLNVRIKTMTGDTIKFRNTDIKEDCGKQDEKWNDLGWALQVKEGSQGAQPAQGELVEASAGAVHTAFELTHGWLEYKFEGDEAVNSSRTRSCGRWPTTPSGPSSRSCVTDCSRTDLVLEARTLTNPEQKSERRR